MTGPGVVVVLDDAPPTGQYGPDVRPDSLVVHQQDLEAVINALWAGGAEAMTLQDQSIDYAQALAVQRQMLQTVSEKTDTAQALKILAENSARWRTQFPLIFATAAMLQERVQPAVRGPQAGSDASTSTNADSASVQGADRWRDRERMRSRERIDRSGSSL